MSANPSSQAYSLATIASLALVLVVALTPQPNASATQPNESAPQSNASIPASSLMCACNVCGEVNETCLVHLDNESVCFKSVERSRSPENNSIVTDTSYGCLSGGNGNIANLQCHTNSLKHIKPTYIQCCNDQDNCNLYLPDPTGPEWPIDQPDEKPTSKEPSKPPYAFIIAFLALTVFILYVIGRVILRLVFAAPGSSKNSAASTCSLKVDPDNYHQIFASSTSTSSNHSYSVTEDPCHKPPVPNHGVSFLPEDFTSGRGNRMLLPRTMAFAIRSGKTDHVGDGRFGRVFRGEYHGEDVAVKAFRTIDQDSWSREDTIFRSLNHENIVRFIASEVTTIESTTTEIWMYLEYCPYGSLCDYLDHNEILGPQQAIKILYSIINGLNYLHEDYAQASRLYKPSIAHRDIKSKNILMRSPESCCIADFGHALIKIDEDNLDYGKYQYLQVGTIRYMAPEILRPDSSINYRQFSTFAQADLYQYGLILWEVCHRTALDILHPAGHHKLPYDGVVPQNPDIQDMIKIVCEDQYRPPIYDHWRRYPLMRPISYLMVECWRPKPKARMETLGVKKRLKQLYDQMIPCPRSQYELELHHNNFSLSPNSRSDRDKTRSTDVTL